jgi:hypothetical protein
MNPDRQLAIQYLHADPKGTWTWAEDGSVIVWRDGSTIAFREEVLQILEWLAPNGLPPFGAIVFLLAACRGKVCEVSDLLGSPSTFLFANRGKNPAILRAARDQLKLQIGTALDQLRRVALLSDEMRSGIKARCILAEAVFEPTKAERHVDAAAVLRGIRGIINGGESLSLELPRTKDSYVRQLHMVAEGLKRHTTESLALRMRTGLDALPKEIAPDLPAAERARTLIEELSHDRDIGGVARAARELLAAVRLPRRLGKRDQLAIGGVADLSNRGPLDRLLLSELAHDDLTLSVRVALNEALYLRREPPMREPPGTLALLLDSGVRLWGIPRVLATGVALALVARDKQHSEVRAWRAHGKHLTQVDLLSRNGLTQHLGALEIEAHPGDSLPAFAEATAFGAPNQSVLITQRDTLDDPEFRRALAEQTAGMGFVATVDRAGRFELHALPLAHRPPVCEADLDLASVFSDEVGVIPIRVECDPGLPAIFGVRPFPLLLPLAGKLDFWTRSDGFTYGVLNDRRLVQFRDHRAGARILASELPGGRAVWMECVSGVLHIVKAPASQRPARLLSLPLPDGQLRVMDLMPGEDVRRVHRSGEVILVIRNKDVEAYALSDGRSLDRVAQPYQFLNGRFFRGPGNFYFATWDGQGVKFEPVTLPPDCPFQKLAGVFDREGLEGPWVLHTDGDVISTANGERIRLKMLTGFAPHDYALLHSHDGHRLYMTHSSKWDSVHDLKTGAMRDNQKLRTPARVLDQPPPLPGWTVFRIVESVAWLRDGLAFCGRKNRWRKLSMTARRTLAIHEIPAHEQTELRNKIPFDSQSQPEGQGCTLRIATWPCGSKAFLDSRGLLHLKSHDSSVPEISLVLSGEEVAGWTSDGHVCGPKFFFDGDHDSDPERVFECLLQFLNYL